MNADRDRYNDDPMVGKRQNTMFEKKSKYTAEIILFNTKEFFFFYDK